MPTSELALRLFLILLPGFSAAYLVQALTVRVKQSDLEKVIEAFVFSFVIYVTFYLFHPHQVPLLFVGEGSKTNPAFRWLDLFLLLIITVGWAIALIVFVNKDGTIFLRRIGLTERTSRGSIWNDVFQGEIKEHIVQVELADGRSVQGLVAFYSDTAEESSIFLSSARWVGEAGELTEIPGSGILLTKEARIVSISFLDPL